MKGTIVNSSAILAGSIIGLSLGSRIPQRIKTIMMQALGLSVIVIGLSMALKATNMIATVACVLGGAVTGELLRIEQGIEVIGRWLKNRFRSNSSTFVEGFVMTSVLYLTGAMVIVGAIQDGTTGDASTLYIKSLLDGTASLIFASTLGVGVAFSALSVLIVQGSLTLLSSSLLFLQEPTVLSAVVATGGVLILGIGINILELTKIRLGNMIPALVYAVLWALYL
ncbi:MAG: DUF554 domain-containing protein [Deltaproteobacteria bacterium]|nr:DUF554 domain-containing protein [Deltaproteobacteria bacterium]